MTGRPTDSSFPPHLYIHVPFCVRKCRYCAFYSVEHPPEAFLDRFVTAVLLELGTSVSRPSLAGLSSGLPPDSRGEADSASISVSQSNSASQSQSASQSSPSASLLQTLYIGGGTPSLLGALRVSQILDAVRAVAPLSRDCEVTLEVNPETIDRAGLAACREAGVNRVSIGVQSLHDSRLSWLGRIHDSRRALRAVDDALAVGHRVSIDLIYGLPGQSVGEWAADLGLAAGLGVGHISAYELSYEPGTPIHGERVRCSGSRRTAQREHPASCATSERLFFETHERLAQLGFEGYEVSSFARSPAERSRHNLATWAHEPYLGLGPGAHSYWQGAGVGGEGLALRSLGEVGAGVSLPRRSLGGGGGAGKKRGVGGAMGTVGPHGQTRTSLRRWNLPDLDGWLTALESGHPPPREEEVLSPGQVLLERIMLGLRCRQGIDLEACRRDCGQEATDRILAGAVRPIEDALLVRVNDSIVPTLAGMALADRLAVELCS